MKMKWNLSCSLLVGVLVLKLCSAENQALVTVERETADDKETTEDSKKKYDIFVPEKYWKVVKEGEAIPRGLHVRINMQTGLKEAKLLDETEKKEPDVKTTFTKDDLENALKHIDKEHHEGESNIDMNQFIEDTARMQKFKSYEKIKSELDELNISVKSDYEIIIKLMEDVKKNPQAAYLDELEYYVHQYDNALDFVRLGGITDIVIPNLNSTSPEIRAAAAFLLGSAMQSNPKVQISAWEAGITSVLLRLISGDEPLVQRRAFYAISCFVRHFPLAQQTLIKEGGLTVFYKVFQSHSTESTKLQLKVITLLHDLLEEQQLAEEFGEKERQNQYKQQNLPQLLKEQGFCSSIPKLLKSPTVDNRDVRHDHAAAVNSEFPLRPEHDVIEKVVSAMLALSPVCKDMFQQHLTLLRTIESHYRNLASHELDDDYYNNLAVIKSE